MRFRQGSLTAFWMSLLLAGLCGPGCALFKQPVIQSSTNKIPSLRPPPDAVALDIVFVERPRGDELLGPKLWDQVDEVGSLSPSTRTMLRANGLRVGVAGSDPPAALQTLLGLRTDFSYEPSAEQCKQLIGRQVMLRSGGETEVLATPLIEQCRIRLPDVDDPEAPFQVREYQAAHGLLRLTVHHVQQGWVRIDFVPELHHGNERLRHEASDTGWQFTNRQLVDPLYSQRFSLTLAVGEMVLLTGDRAIVTGETPVDTQPLGELLFHSSDQKSAIQRMLVIRASDLSKDADLYANLKPSGS